MTKHTITLSALDLSITYSVKDNSPRGCHTVHGAQLQIGDKIVIDNYFHEIVEETAAETTETPTETETRDTVRTLDLLNELDTGDHGDSLNDYRDTDGYICDIIAEIADADTSIYYNDILDFIRENPEALADVIREGLYDPSSNYDLYKHGQAAEYMTIERDIYDHLPDSLFAAAVNFIRFDLDIVEIPAELAELLREWCEDADTGDRMDEIPDRVREYLADFTEEVTAEDARSLPDFTSPEAFFCEPD